MISAFGVDHGEVSKSYGKIASRLASAAEKGSPYATQRVAAGERSHKVYGSMRAANKQVRGARGATPGQKRRIKTAEFMVPSHKFSGGQNAANAKRLTWSSNRGGYRAMEQQAEAKLKANRATATPVGSPKKTSTGSRKKILIGSGIGATGAGVGGAALYQRKKGQS